MNLSATDTLLGLIAALLADNLPALTAHLASAKDDATVFTRDLLRARLIELVAADGKVVAQPSASRAWKRCP